MSALQKSDCVVDRLPEYRGEAVVGRIERAKPSPLSRAKLWVTGGLLALVMSLFPQLAHAQETPTLPTTGVNLADFIAVAITGLGAIVLVVVGGYLAFKLIKIGLRWVGRIGG